MAQLDIPSDKERLSRPRPNLAAYMPLLAATAFTAALYFGQVSLLASKLGEVLVGVFDTSVPAFPLAGRSGSGLSMPPLSRAGLRRLPSRTRRC